MIRFQTPRDYFEDFTVCLKAEPELLLNTTGLILLSEWLVVGVRFIKNRFIHKQRRNTMKFFFFFVNKLLKIIYKIQLSCSK